MLAEADEAEALVMQAQAEPQGRIRFSCLRGMIEPTTELIASFLAKHPKVRLQLLATDRAVDLIEERIDLALRVRFALTTDAALTVRSLGTSTRVLVARPDVAGAITSVEQLSTQPLLVTNDETDEVELHLETEDGRTHVVRGSPRFGCADMAIVKNAASAGLGIAFLPDHVCREALKDGRLAQVLTGWHGREGMVHLMFTTRRGRSPAARALIDHLAEHFPRDAMPLA